MFDDINKMQEPAQATAPAATPGIQPSMPVTQAPQPQKAPKTRNKQPESEPPLTPEEWTTVNDINRSERREEIDFVNHGQLHVLLERKLKAGGIMGLSSFVLDKTLLALGEVLIRLRLKLNAEFAQAERQFNPQDSFLPQAATLEILPLIEHYGVLYAKLLKAVASANHTASLGEKGKSEEDAVA